MGIGKATAYLYKIWINSWTLTTYAKLSKMCFCFISNLCTRSRWIIQFGQEKFRLCPAHLGGFSTGMHDIIPASSKNAWFYFFYFIVCVYLITFNLMLSLNLPTKGILHFFSSVIFTFSFIYFHLLWIFFYLLSTVKFVRINDVKATQGNTI